MKDYFGYTDKICIVTGSSSGIGLATAKMLVDLGAQVYALARNESTIDGLANAIRCDLTDPGSIDAAFSIIPQKIDAFFGVAGLSGDKTDFITIFNCDFTANKYITEKYLKNRMEAGGTITFVSSAAGLNWDKYMEEQNPIVHAETWDKTVEALRELPEVAPANFAYILAKRCISQYAAEAAVELGKCGIRVNNVMPGSTATGMKDEFEKMAGGEEALLRETGIAHRLATPEEMAAPLVFCGSEMATFISGLDFSVDMADLAMKKLGLKLDQMDIPIVESFI